MQNDKIKIRRLCFAVLTLAWMCVIFLYSAQTAEESSEKSLWMGQIVAKLFYPRFGKLPQNQQLTIVESLDFWVRKAAHMTEYCILSLLVAGTLVWKREKEHIRRMCFLAWVCAVAYAATDEFHQLFVPGRAGQLRDVCIDGGGALIGALLALGVFPVILLKRNKGSKLGKKA